MTAPALWLIAGPTAGGKSALALRLAEWLGAEVVNADSMQLYAGLEVLTAAPGPAERARAPHRLYGVADPAEAWSVGRWVEAAAPLLAGGPPKVLVGGTGLYFRALTEGLADIPVPPPAVREAAARRLERLGEDAFRHALGEFDALSARRIAPGDRQRLIRAWSVWEASGRPLTDWRAETRPLLAPASYRAVVVEPARADLYGRCDARLRAMVDAGALDEVRRLCERALSPELPAMKALGVREFARCLEGGCSLEEAVGEAQLSTRRYAKRQLTWFRNQTPTWPRIRSGDGEAQWSELLQRMEKATDRA